MMATLPFLYSIRTNNTESFLRKTDALPFPLENSFVNIFSNFIPFALLRSCFLFCFASFFGSWFLFYQICSGVACDFSQFKYNSSTYKQVFQIKSLYLRWPSAGDSNGTRNHNRLVCKGTLNHLAKLGK